jgi:phosphatidate cytidylyltransferase
MESLLGEHKERVVTGAVLAGAVLLLGVIDSFFLFWAAFGVIYLFAFYEASRLFDVQTNNALYAFAAIIWVVAAFYPYGDDLFVLAGILYASLLAYDQKLEWKNFLPFVYPTAGMLFILTLYSGYGVISLLWLLVVVAMTDIGAYFVGKSIGKTPFCPTSPKKTMEGVVGGVVIATIAGLFVGIAFVEVEKAFIISLFTAVASIFGDLFESHLKRQAGVKDSGDILPGHGGVLDRIDGYLFGAVIMLILLRGIV